MYVCMYVYIYIYIDKTTKPQKEESNLLQNKYRFVNKSNTTWPSRTEKRRDISPVNPFSRQGNDRGNRMLNPL